MKWKKIVYYESDTISNKYPRKNISLNNIINE